MKADVKGVGGPGRLRWCRGRLAPYEAPRYKFRSVLPKSKVGKVLRRALRSEERRKGMSEGPTGGAATR